jgi:hypothetical protein
MVLIAAGCGELPRQTTQPNDRPPEYKKIIRTALYAKSLASVSPSVGDDGRIYRISNLYPPFETSNARQELVVADWTWQVCLKGINRNGRPTYLAVFIKDNYIADLRTSIVTDKCESEVYEPL